MTPARRLRSTSSTSRPTRSATYSTDWFCADIQDRDGALNLIERCRHGYPTIDRFFADGGYAGQLLAHAIAHIDRLVVEIIRPLRRMT